MQELSDSEFSALIARALDELPERYTKNLDNVAITYDDEPNREQRHKLRLRGDQTLFGLYEGVPLIHRGAGYNLVLPDKITLFKRPLLASARSVEALYAQVKHTLWHEIAHHYGLDHDRIYEIEANWSSQH
jgi:predicted Zn-dependent protease with MMP-like domain